MGSAGWGSGVGLTGVKKWYSCKHNGHCSYDHTPIPHTRTHFAALRGLWAGVASTSSAAPSSSFSPQKLACLRMPPPSGAPSSAAASLEVAARCGAALLRGRLRGVSAISPSRPPAGAAMRSGEGGAAAASGAQPLPAQAALWAAVVRPLALHCTLPAGLAGARVAAALALAATGAGARGAGAGSGWAAAAPGAGAPGAGAAGSGFRGVMVLPCTRTDPVILMAQGRVPAVLGCIPAARVRRVRATTGGDGTSKAAVRILQGAVEGEQGRE